VSITDKFVVIPLIVLLVAGLVWATAPAWRR
jgi:hypothetical protein